MEQIRESSTSRRWVRHAIDTSWSQAHSVLVADVDQDGEQELVAGKRYMGHDGKDPGEYDPLAIYWYNFDRSRRTWRRGTIAEGGPVGFGLDPKAIDLDDDGDIDVLAADRSGLFWLENLLQGQTQDSQPPAPHRSVIEDHTKPLLYSPRTGETPQVLPVQSAADWALRRADILAGIEAAMGPLPDSSRRVPLDVASLGDTPTTLYVRRKITYAAEPQDRVPAYLLIPNQLAGPAPAMLCLHQTTPIGKDEPAGLGENNNLDYAHELAQRGYVCLVPDYPSFGDYDYDFRARGGDYASGSMKAIWNNIRAIDLLESLPQVDTDRIGAIGHSLGGHNTLFTAVFDQRLRAVVTSCGFTAFHDYYRGDLRGWTSDRYMPRIDKLYRNDPDQVPFDFHEVLAAIAPRGVFVNAPLGDDNFDVGGVKKVAEAAGDVYRLLGAEGKLTVLYPDAQHDFPNEVRQAAYAWLDVQRRR
jgi:dienelactone hydrolase